LDLGDVVLIALILLALWTFIPRPLRAALRSGLGPTVDALSESMRAGVRAGGRAIQYAAYRWFLGVDVPGSVREYADNDMSSEEDEGKDDARLSLAKSPAATTQQNNNNPIAITQQNSNELLLQESARTLAIMVHAGKVGETEGIKMVYGVSPSSSNPKYIAARAALKKELAKLDPPKYTDLDEQSRPVLRPVHKPRTR
jgi:hypothetical protein